MKRSQAIGEVCIEKSKGRAVMTMLEPKNANDVRIEVCQGVLRVYARKTSENKVSELICW